ncbi:MAG: precorrin-2 C(20)-methyltransferase [Pseudomonadota bacterium]
MSSVRTTGKLYIIGVGPGDPDLMTLKAVRLIGMADVIAYPVTESGQSRARRISAEFITQHHKTIAYTLPMSVDPAPAQAAYDEVANQMRTHLDAGRTVALLCEGDPFLYGSGTHIHRRLAAGYDTQVVPGVTSLTASAAASGEPLVVRNEILKVLPAPLSAEELRKELQSFDRAAIIKLGRHFKKVSDVLHELGLAKNAMLISNATADEQVVKQLSDVDPESGEYFAMILVGREGDQ